MTSNQSTLTFRFSLDKFINALAYFASQGIRDLTKLKAVKLLLLIRTNWVWLGAGGLTAAAGPIAEAEGPDWRWRAQVSA